MKIQSSLICLIWLHQRNFWCCGWRWNVGICIFQTLQSNTTNYCWACKQHFDHSKLPKHGFNWWWVLNGRIYTYMECYFHIAYVNWHLTLLLHYHIYWIHFFRKDFLLSFAVYILFEIEIYHTCHFLLICLGYKFE